MKSVIRTARSSDIAQCAELLGVLFSQEHEFRADPDAQSRGLALIIRNPELGRIFVAENDGAIQGMVMLLFTVSTFLGKKVALLEDMVVDPRWRHQGIGSMLIHHAEEFALNQGFGRITLLTDQDNESAQRFYRSKGFEQSSMVVFRKMLDASAIKEQPAMNDWMCRECGYLYNPAEGYPEEGIKENTPFEDISGEWRCPVCYAEKGLFDILA